jgi:hypothetical protein
VVEYNLTFKKMSTFVVGYGVVSAAAIKNKKNRIM